MSSDSLKVVNEAASSEMTPVTGWGSAAIADATSG
jgi:hypothetical protein